MVVVQLEEEEKQDGQDRQDKKRESSLFLYPVHPVHPVNSFLRFKLNYYSINLSPDKCLPSYYYVGNAVQS
jgi:hypothetical protein